MAVCSSLAWHGLDPDVYVCRCRCRCQCRCRRCCRLVDQCARVGLRQLADELQVHHQRLQDMLTEATAGKDG